ncbi:MAG: hypothetical protein AB2789_13255 [Candidatus Thiodiazotropha endolucinida]
MKTVEIFLYVILSILAIFLAFILMYRAGLSYEEAIKKAERYMAYLVLFLLFAFIGFIWVMLEG